MSKNNVNTKKILYCDRCGKSFKFKASLVKHIISHNTQEEKPSNDGLTCVECNIIFKNKGLLRCHYSKVHNQKSKPQKINKFECAPCETSFLHQRDLKQHIRLYHFNLLSKIPYCHFKKVNQVWFENVLNSKNIVEIKKVAENILVMRKLDDNTAMKVSDHSTEVIDLHDLYPTHKYKGMQCTYCFRYYDQTYMSKHISDVHLKYKKNDVT